MACSIFKSLFDEIDFLNSSILNKILKWLSISGSSFYMSFIFYTTTYNYDGVNALEFIYYLRSSFIFSRVILRLIKYLFKIIKCYPLISWYKGL